MSAGYGRGYYGVGQLAPQQQPRRRGSGSIKLAVVVGVGAVVWYMWPRSSKLGPETGHGGEDPKPPPPPAPSGSHVQIHLMAPQLPAAPVMVQPQPLEHLAGAHARGYSSQKAYEDAVVATARQLKETGAQVTLAPHLQHLATRLES